ncbi:hypothetical protein AO956_32920 [Pseudomonas aeruginosa]|nr:hypothetical protein AO956_32920 [Pseudomonas aeruginosa]
MNCAYSLSAWLTLDRLSSAAKCATLDLPELLYLLDIPLVLKTVDGETYPRVRISTPPPFHR